MCGLYYGNKYTYSYNVRKNKKEREGVFRNTSRKKWIVMIKNKGKSKHVRPIIKVAQFDNKEDADICFNRLKKELITKIK